MKFILPLIAFTAVIVNAVHIEADRNNFDTALAKGLQRLIDNSADEEQTSDCRKIEFTNRALKTTFERMGSYTEEFQVEVDAFRK